MPYLDQAGTEALWKKVKGIAGNKLTATSGDSAYTLGLADKDGNSLSSAEISAATSTAAGVMTKAQAAKLAGIAEGATKNTVNDATITVKQGSATKGSFTLNQSSAATITLDANTDTHYESKTITGASATATANAAATNGNVYLNHVENGAVKSAHNIVGSGAVTVASDANGKVTVNAASPGNGKVTIKQAGTTVGSFTMNQSGATTIELTDSSYTLPTASATVLGGVKVGSNLSIASDGTLSADAQQYTLPVASTTALGGVKVGSNLSISSDGVLSATDTTYPLVSDAADGIVPFLSATQPDSELIDHSAFFSVLTGHYNAAGALDTSQTEWTPLTGDHVYVLHDDAAQSLTEWVDALDENKQDTLTAGANITISGTTISAKDTTYGAATASALGLVKIATSATSGSTAAITSGAVYTALSSKANLASPTLTGTPKAPTAAAGTNTTQIATTAFVSTAITNAKVGAATFQGTASEEADFSGTTYKKGWYWVCSAAFTFGTNTVEAGDMIFATSDKGSAYAATDFNVVQANITAIPTSYIESLN